MIVTVLLHKIYSKINCVNTKVDRKKYEINCSVFKLVNLDTQIYFFFSLINEFQTMRSSKKPILIIATSYQKTSYGYWYWFTVIGEKRSKHRLTFDFFLPTQENENSTGYFIGNSNLSTLQLLKIVNYSLLILTKKMYSFSSTISRTLY